MNIKIISYAITSILISSSASTSASEITRSYPSGLKYEDYSCAHLDAEITLLAKYKTKIALFGYIPADGGDEPIEASLEDIHTEMEAIQKAKEIKKCTKGVKL